MDLPLDISANNSIPSKTTESDRGMLYQRCPQGMPIHEHNTTDKQQEILWYPMRVTYAREMKLKAVLDDLGIENYIPMKWVEKVFRGKKKSVQLPAIHNLIFIHTSKSIIQQLKNRLEDSTPMRYLMNKAENRPLVVPQKQMEDFIKVTSSNENDFFYLENPDFAAKPGERVRITCGIFKGIEGKILRIHNNKKVVVSIEGVAAVAISYIPTAMIEKLD